MNSKTGLHLALCTHIPELWDNRLLDPSLAGHYPSCGWPKELRQCWTSGDVVTGDVAASHVACGTWSPNEVLIIQADGSKQGRDLQKMGCRAFLHICWESPLYAFRVYDNVSAGSTPYAFHQVAAQPKNKPCIDVESPIRMACLPGSQQDWIRSTQQRRTHERRLRIALIAAYKPLRSELKRCIQERQWRSTPFGAITDIRRLKSETYRDAKTKQTNHLKLQVLQQLSDVLPVDLYGKGWEQCERLTHQKTQWLGPCGDKQTTLASYAYSLVLENCIWSGYHTEKLAQAIAAGTIPITCLDAETEKQIPKACYIHINCNDLSATRQILQSMCHADRVDMRQAGERFLASSFAKNYFEVDYAQDIAEKARLFAERLNKSSAHNQP